jgi:guanine nucleotide-binding protein G(i) subunit alpha
MKILHQDGFNNTELISNRQVIYRNLIDSAKSLVQFLKEYEILPANPEIQVRLCPKVGGNK